MLACSPGAASCESATVRRTCNADGMAYTTAPCPAGETCSGGVCAATVSSPVAVPVSPGPGARVRPRPQFRWTLRDGADGARLQVCRDQSCTTLVFQQDATGTTFTPLMDLPTAALWWRVAGRAGSAVNPTPSAPRFFRVSPAGPWTNGDGTDINGDGYSDLVISAGSSSAGRVLVYLGSARGVPSSPSQSLLEPPSSQGSDAQFGQGLAFVGDVDFDGYNDVVVGAPNARRNGMAYFYRGGTSGLTGPVVEYRSNGGATNVVFGRYVAGIGDVNNDGHADFAIGEYGNMTPQIFLGRSATIPMFPAQTLARGKRVVGVGDVNGDGYDDVVNHHGMGLHLGGSSGVSLMATAPVEGFEFDCDGVIDAGDVNGDGRKDLVITCPPTLTNPAGRAYLFGGTSTGFSRSPSSTFISTAMRYGDVVDTLGDVNQDNFSDFVVSGGGVGAWVHYGGASGLSSGSVVSLAVPAGSGTSVLGFGAGLSNVGDLDGDGVLDLAVADPARNRLHLYRPNTTGTTWTLATTLTGTAGDPDFGRAIASAN